MKSHPIASFLVSGIFALLVSSAAGLATVIHGDVVGLERISAGVAVATALFGIFAIGAAFLTFYHQQIDGQRQRRMETLHTLTGEYERIFDEIYGLKPQERDDDSKIRQFYNRYFTAFMRGFHSHRSGLVSDKHMIDWTATILARFRHKHRLLHPDDSPRTDEMETQWEKFDQSGLGPRPEFRTLMQGVIAAAARESSASPREEARAVLETALKRPLRDTDEF